MTIFAPPPMPPFPEPVEWTLLRQVFGEPRNGREGYTLGTLTYGLPNDQRACFTVEDQDRRLEEGNGKVYGQSAIPLGRYRLTLYQSPKHGECILLNTVPGFSYVEIHASNTAEELLGCIAVGTARTLDGVRNCKPALIPMIGELRRSIMGGVSVYLKVMRAE